MGLFARAHLPRWLHRAFLRWYIRRYGVDMSESVGDIDDFGTFTEFFTRSLRSGLRPVDPRPDALVAPCDGRVYACGTVEDGMLPQSEGRHFRALELLGGDSRFDAGEYAVLYLSPRDYHRVHTPREGLVRGFRYVPGHLWPVFPGAAAQIEGLFAHNERLVTWLHTDLGEVAVVMVGAFGVGRIRVVYDPIISNQGHPPTEGVLPEPMAVARCGELGRFEMGSTVILLLPPGSVTWTVRPGDAIRLGAAIATLRSN